MAIKTPQNTKPSTNHHFIRTFFSSIIGFFAVVLIIISILVIWIDRTVTDTDTYVKTVTPIVTEPDIQNFVISKASSALLDNKDSPIREIANELLTPDQIAGKTDEQLKIEVTPIVEESLRSVIASPEFAELWKSNNQTIHSQFVTQLGNDSDSIELNFRPVITGTIDLLSTTKLAFATDKFDIPADAGQVTLEDKQLNNVRGVYDHFKKAMLAVIVAAILAIALSVLISVHHLKTVRRIALLTGVFSAILAAMLSATTLIKAGGDELQQKMGIALIDGIGHDLRLSLIIIAVVGIGGTLGSKVYSVLKSRTKTGTK